MRYPLDFEKDFEKTLLFWIGRFLHSKLNSLSNRQVKDPKRLAGVITALRGGSRSIEELSRLSKEARNAGLIGINTYYKPLEKLYYYLRDISPASMREIDEELVSDFLASATAGLSDATKKNYRIAMINFFGFIERQNGEDDGKAHHYGIELKNWGGLSGKSGSKLPSYMREDEVERFLEAIETHPFRQDVSARNRLLIKMILFTGIRVGEALNLKDLVLVQEALGHASLDTSRIYTHFDKDRLKEAASVMDEIAGGDADSPLPLQPLESIHNASSRRPYLWPFRPACIKRAF